MASNLCFICNEVLNNDVAKVTTVREKGLKTFIESSRKRKDGEHVQLSKKSAVDVHERCRRNYSNERMIDAHLKKMDQGTEKIKRRSTEAPFSFKTHCFMCGLDITPEFIEKERKKKTNRNNVYQVRVLKLKETILKRAKERGDAYGQAIIERLLPVSDLVASDCQYHNFCLRKLYNRPKIEEKGKRGAFINDVEAAMEDVFTFLENSDGECQFSLDELMDKIKGNYRPDKKTVKAHLLKKYGSDIIITFSPNKMPVVCFKNTGYKILNDAWYQQALKNEQEERLRIVKTAAAIIVEDIRSQVYETEKYPPPDKFLEGNEELIPETLRTFMETVVLNNKRGDHDVWKKKSTAMAHCLVATVRPKSFVSPVLVGLAVFLYKKYGSRKLIDVVSSLGFCSSYLEAVRLEASAINGDLLKVNQPCFSQQVYDNADFNVHTIDGYNTFHVMGGISCITPKDAVAPNQFIPRLKTIPSHEVSGSYGALQLNHFERTKPQGLAEIKIKDLKDMYTPTETVIPSVSDLLWLYEKSRDIPGLSGWNGFMEDVTRDNPYEVTFVRYQPFINAPPNDYDTIFTALLTGVEESKSLNQVTCLVTFDQPLYLKARDILASRPADPALSNVVLRLGGFHLLMSFMGAIGYIMQGSGLTELFNTIYASNAIEKIMSGHAYARAVRAHMLAHRTLAQIMFRSMALSSTKVDQLEEILLNMDRTEILSNDVKEIVKDLQEEFEANLQLLAKRGPTAKLWVVYFEMVTLIKHFIEAERSSNWDLHLQTIHEMLPFFHTSGHNLYAKCSHLYLQDMHMLKTTMPSAEYERFTTRGCFTIRRSDKLWCGTWSDMAIEQTLMKSMKTSGGLTHGRGVTASVVTKWTKGMTALHNVCQEIEHFTRVELSTSEQHVDSRNTMQKRDNTDVHKLLHWFHEHPPFPETTDLVSLSTGVVADERINCHLSKEMGIESIQRIVGGDFQAVKFKRSERVLPLAIMNSSIQIQDRTVVINPTTLFQRMTIVKRSDEELREFLNYELSPYPLSLFDEHGMRKGTKSSLYRAFAPTAQVDLNLNDTKYIIDGGFLLHRVKWHHGKTYADICRGYVSYVKSNYKSNAVVIFDGYPNESYESTKRIERLRRAQRKQSAAISFTESMVPTVSQESFLANSKNKKRLISMLMEKFEDAKIDSQQAVEDADILIITTALMLAPLNKYVTVVGEDIDLLVILIGLCSPDIKNVFFLKPGKGKVSQTLYNPHLAIDKTLSDHILFLHAMSGCDTTSALFNQGKLKFLKVLQKNSDLQPAIDAFKDPHAHQNEVADAGNVFLMALYGKGHETSLNDLRYRHYISSSYKNKTNIASLPPTEDAARQHSLRVYFQVQQWLSGKTTLDEQQRDPCAWGWKKTKSGLVPVPATLNPAPNSILRYISCKCKKGCQRNCGCRKAGLHCSPICKSCEGLCDNVEPPDDNLDIGEETDERGREQNEERRLHDADGMSNVAIYFLIIYLSLRHDHKLLFFHLSFFR